jgi:hypothetical protein
MVVISASISTKLGKVLVARQFVSIVRSRIESLLAAFPKLRESLGETSKQHTSIETSSVRYLYQKIEDLYLVVITSKQSNIVEDLATLHILSKIIPEYCGMHITEKAVVSHGFEIIFAFDEVVALGYKENITKIEQIRTYTNMDSQEEITHERIQQNQEREAKKIAERKLKEIEQERKERETMGLPAFSGPGSANPGYYGSGSSLSSMQSKSSSKDSSISSSNKFRSSESTSRDESSYSRSNTQTKPTATKTVRKGLQLGKKVAANTLMEQLEREGESIDIPTKASQAQQAAALEPLNIKIIESMNCSFDRDGGLVMMDVTGEFSVNATAEEATKCQILVPFEGDIQFKIHPNIHRELFLDQQTIALRDKSKTFPLNTAIQVLKWRIQSQNEDDAPLKVSCWPTVGSGGHTVITLEYSLGQKFYETHDLRDVSITIPIVAKGTPAAQTEEGSYFMDTRTNHLEWQIPVISADNANGSLEIQLQQWDDNGDTSWMFPITVNFSSQSTLCPINVREATNNGEPVRYSLLKELRVNNFQIGA